jgi:adenylate cyclase class 2
MKDEIEATFTDIEISAMRKKLTSAGATLVLPERTMKRVVIDYPDKRLQSTGDSWVRVRDEGDKVTLTFKQTKEHDLSSIKEIEVTVSDYQKTIDIMLAMGMVIHTDQETKRETWNLDGVEVTIDQWPWIPPIVEVEGDSESEIKAVAEKLGLDWAEALFGSVIVAYEKQYPKVKDIGRKISSEPKINFSIKKPDWLIE